MNSVEIFTVLKNDYFSKNNFFGVLARDQLPKEIKWPSSFIMNTDKSSKPGAHWLAISYNKHGKCEFYDPLGFSPKYYNMDDYLKNTSKEYFYNSQQMQGIFSEYCGYYCTLFIMVQSRNHNLDFFLKLFYKNTKFNDLIIEDLIKDNFFV